MPGASASLIRDLGFFPAADTTQPRLVLAAWALVGVVVSAIGPWRSREVVHLPE